MRYSVVLYAACVAFFIPAHASYSQEVWNSDNPAAAVSKHLHDLSCSLFGAAANCSTASVQSAFETSSFETVRPTVEMFEAWYESNAAHVLSAINEPVLNLRLKVVEALLSPQESIAVGAGVAFEKQVSQKRQLCESRGGSKLYCQKMNPLPWDATSEVLHSKLVCSKNMTRPFEHFSVPISTQEVAVLFSPLIDQDHEDVMTVANITQLLQPVFEQNLKRFKTVRFQRFIATDGVSLIYPAVSSKHVNHVYPGQSDLKDLREGLVFAHSSCARRVVFVLDVSSKNMHFDLHHRSEALILRIFRLLKPFDEVQLVLTSSLSQQVVLGNGESFVAANSSMYLELQEKLSQMLRSGLMSMDAGILFAQDLLRTPSTKHVNCVRRFLIALSSDEASLLSATIENHNSLEGLQDDYGNFYQPYFIMISMDSEGQNELAEMFCSKKMFYTSIPSMQSSKYRGLDVVLPRSDAFISDAAFAVINYCTFIFELLAVDNAADVNNVVWTPPFYDPYAASGSLVITTSVPVYTESYGVPRFRGTVEVDHVFFSYPSSHEVAITDSESSIASMLNKLPQFLGARVDVVLTGVAAGTSFADATFLKKLNSLALPLQSLFNSMQCDRPSISHIFADLRSSRSSAELSIWLQWTQSHSIEPRVFADKVMNSPRSSGSASVSSFSNANASLLFKHSQATSLVFLRILPQVVGDLALPLATTTAQQCIENSTACRALTDGLFFVSNSSKKGGYLLSSEAFECPLCARDAAVSKTPKDPFFALHEYASGKSDDYRDSNLRLLPTAVCEINILSSVTPMLARNAAMYPDVSAAVVTGVNGVSIAVSNKRDSSFDLNAFQDFSQEDWFADAASLPGVLHLSFDPSIDSRDPESCALIVSVGIIVQPRGAPWIPGRVTVQGLAAVAHLRLRSSWANSILISSLLNIDSRHVCATVSGICLILNSRGFVVATTSAYASVFKHVETVYPLLASALLKHCVFVQAWDRRFEFSLDMNFHLSMDQSTSNHWTLNASGPSIFHAFFANIQHSVSIAKLPGVAGVLMIVVPHRSNILTLRHLQIPQLLGPTAPQIFHSHAVVPRFLSTKLEIELRSAELSKIMQQTVCYLGEPSWLLGVSVGVGMVVLFFIVAATLRRFNVVQRVMRLLFERKSSAFPALKHTPIELNRYEFKLCSPNDFVVQKSILRCVSILHKAFSTLEKEIVVFNTIASSQHIIAHDIDGQRLKIQNHFEVLLKQRTLLHERIVSRMLLCASLRLRASAYVDIVNVLAEHISQFEAAAKRIELVRDQLQELCDASM